MKTQVTNVNTVLSWSCSQLSVLILEIAVIKDIIFILEIPWFSLELSWTILRQLSRSELSVPECSWLYLLYASWKHTEFEHVVLNKMPNFIVNTTPKILWKPIAACICGCLFSILCTNRKKMKQFCNWFSFFKAMLS